jgi:hypothetical protein
MGTALWVREWDVSDENGHGTRCQHRSQHAGVAAVSGVARMRRCVPEGQRW